MERPTCRLSPERWASAGRALQFHGHAIFTIDSGTLAEDALLLIHGFGGDLNNWLFNHEALAASRAVYAIDLPGHGASTKVTGAASLDDLADAVSGFMEAVGIASADVVGHSMGGGVCLALTRRAPQKVKSLTLIASAALGSDINGAYIDGFVAGNTRNALKPLLAQLFSDAGLVTRQLIDDMLKYKRLEGVDEALATLAGGLFPGGRQSEVLADMAVKQPEAFAAVVGQAKDALGKQTQAAA